MPENPSQNSVKRPTRRTDITNTCHKDMLPQNEKFLKNFFYCYIHQLKSKQNIYALFGRLEQFYSCFYCSIFDAPFCYLVE